MTLGGPRTRNYIASEESTLQGRLMSLVSIVLVLLVVGVVLWLINAYVPMAGPIKTLLNAVVVIVLVWWLLKAFGILSSGPPVRISG